ncbi:hypothetical protein B0T25DRAFT_526600 [Lasiosphaeria hispida]|uniref:Uncharacterized protein n=1 Tax=Lasiosphaeria hispida TaxID=260671 RepID=A0AAJ0MK54_9PEZI|nr:hypothetical protein B0T25DRAFT_526600 [Lasiosphaeria hispida]
MSRATSHCTFERCCDFPSQPSIDGDSWLPHGPSPPISFLHVPHLASACQRFTAPPKSSQQSPLVVPVRCHSRPGSNQRGGNRTCSTCHSQDRQSFKIPRQRRKQLNSPSPTNISVVGVLHWSHLYFNAFVVAHAPSLTAQEAALCYSTAKMNKSYHASPSMSVRRYAIPPAQFEASDNRRDHTTPPCSNQYSAQKQKRLGAFSIMPDKPSASTATSWCRRCHAIMSLDHCRDPKAVHGSAGKHSSNVVGKDDSSSSFPPLNRQDATVGQGSNLR